MSALATLLALLTLPILGDAQFNLRPVIEPYSKWPCSDWTWQNCPQRRPGGGPERQGVVRADAMERQDVRRHLRRRRRDTRTGRGRRQRAGAVRRPGGQARGANQRDEILLARVHPVLDVLRRRVRRHHRRRGSRHRTDSRPGSNPSGGPWSGTRSPGTSPSARGRSVWRRRRDTARSTRREPTLFVVLEDGDLGMADLRLRRGGGRLYRVRFMKGGSRGTSRTCTSSRGRYFPTPGRAAAHGGRRRSPTPIERGRNSCRAVDPDTGAVNKDARARTGTCPCRATSRSPSVSSPITR